MELVLIALAFFPSAVYSNVLTDVSWATAFTANIGLMGTFIGILLIGMSLSRREEVAHHKEHSPTLYEH